MNRAFLIAAAVVCSTSAQAQTNGAAHAFPPSGHVIGAPLTAIDPYGTSVCNPTTTTTACLQESLANAFPTPPISTAPGSDLFWYGGKNSGGGGFGPLVLHLFSPLQFPAAQGAWLNAGTITYNCVPAVAASCFTFDSLMMAQMTFRGQIGAVAGYPAVTYKPTNNLPDGFPGIVDCDMRFQALVGPLLLTYGTSNASISCSTYVHELNSINESSYALRVVSPAAGQGFTSNYITIPHLHGVLTANAPLAQLGTGAPGGSFGGNRYQLGISAADYGASNSGAQVYESRSLFDLNVSGVSTGYSLKYETGATNNIALLYGLSPCQNLADLNGVTSGNINIGCGDITIGTRSVALKGAATWFSGATFGASSFTPWAGSTSEWRSGTNQRLAVSGANLLGAGMSLHTFNDAINANTPLEVRASFVGFTQGGVCIGNNACTNPGVGNLSVAGVARLPALPNCNVLGTDANGTIVCKQ